MNLTNSLMIVIKLLILKCIVVAASSYDEDSVKVKVEQGWLQGEVLTVVTGDTEYFSFKGVPFAKPPVGDLRFMPPQPPEPWPGVRNATKHAPVCVQKDIYTQQILPGSEDCLYLNIYTPNIKPTKPLPVMFFIHGGGFQSGSGDSTRYGPDYLVEENVILVTINYRLGVLGFLCLDTKYVSGNVGLKDQVAAMIWVRNNIAKFGGDPENVTIFGQSAGGVSVALHNLSPMTKGLYKRSVSMSGVPFNDWALSFEPRRRAFKLGQQLGFWTLDDQKLLNFLRNVSADKLIDTAPAVLLSEDPNVIIKQFLFTPVVEVDSGAEHFLTVDPIEALKEGKVHDVDFMIGHTSVEGLSDLMFLEDTLWPLYAKYDELLVPREILNNISSSDILNLSEIIHRYYFGTNPISPKLVKEFVKYISDSSYNYDIMRYAKMLPKIGRIYNYRFSILSNMTTYGIKNDKYDIIGATHEDDLMYLFYPEASNLTISRDSDEYRLIKQTCGLYANFAKSGNPTPDNSLGVLWPEYNNVTEYYLDIGNTLTIGQHLDRELLSFWKSIYEAAGMPFY